MEINEIIVQLTPIFRDVLDNEDILLNEATTATDIEEWDSLNHIQLIVAIEKKYKIKFNAIEIRAFKNVGEMCAAISNKLNS